MIILKELIEAERVMSSIGKLAVPQEGVFNTLYLMLKSIISFHKIMNPLIFTPADYILKRFTQEERDALDEINLKYEDLRYFFHKISALKILNANALLLKVIEVLGEDEIKSLNIVQKDYYNEIHQIYFAALGVIILFILFIL